MWTVETDGIMRLGLDSAEKARLYIDYYVSAASQKFLTNPLPLPKTRPDHELDKRLQDLDIPCLKARILTGVLLPLLSRRQLKQLLLNLKAEQPRETQWIRMERLLPWEDPSERHLWIAPD